MDGAVEFRLALQIACIDCLDEVVEFEEGGWLAHMQNLIFDLVWEAIVENAPKTTFSIASDPTCQVVELDYILVDLLTILYGQILEFMLCISNWIVRTKIHLEF